MNEAVSVYKELSRAESLLDKCLEKSKFSESYFCSRVLRSSPIRKRLKSEGITVRKLRRLLTELEDYLNGNG